MTQGVLSEHDIDMIIQDTIAILRQRRVMCHPSIVLHECGILNTRKNRVKVVFFLNEHDYIMQSETT